MKRICFVGNSHLGSLKAAWESFEDKSQDYSCVFFAARAKKMIGLSIFEERLIPDNEVLAKSLHFTSGRSSEISVKDYDIFVVYGLGLKPLILGDAFYSNAALASAISDILKASVNYKLCRMLRTITNAPIYVGHDPLPTYEVGFSEYEADCYRRGVRILGDVMSDKCQCSLISQPDSTIDDLAVTRREFAKGSMRLAVGASNDNEFHPDSDYWHMNADFGREWLKNFFEDCSTKPRVVDRTY